MSSVSKEEQHIRMNNIKEKMSKPGVGRYKPKFEMVEKKPKAFVYRKTPKKRVSNHQKSHSLQYGKSINCLEML
jgi:hypothetical protein